MPFLLKTLLHTPPYVFLIFAFLVWQGLRALKTKVQTVWAVLAAPAIFAVLGVMLLARAGREPAVLALWLAAAVAVVPLGRATAPRLLAVDPNRLRVTRAGSAVPLIRNVAIFVLQYAVALAQALRLSSPGSVAVAAGVISGASLGYTLGWLYGFRTLYRRAVAEAALDPASEPVACRDPIRSRE